MTQRSCVPFISSSSNKINGRNFPNLGHYWREHRQYIDMRRKRIQLLKTTRISKDFGEIPIHVYKKKRSAGRSAQLMHIRMSMTCWKSVFSKVPNLLSDSIILIICIFSLTNKYTNIIISYSQIDISFFHLLFCNYLIIFSSYI